MASKWATETAAQVWCQEKTSDIVFDPVLAEEIANLLDRLHGKPWLGHATNMDLINELRARIEIHFPGGLYYKTVDGEEIANKGVSVHAKSI
jgi:hypothetical protein